jgi:hypothetical protein
MLRTLYLIVDRTLYMAPRLDVEPGERVYFHDRYATYYALDLCNQRFIQIHGHSDTVYLIHPSVIQLTRYDAQHGTHLRDVLYRYLLNHGNLIRTANATYMHRNTVINKLKKINELVPLDLEDGNLCQRLLFSCQAINYYERVLGLQLKL